MVKNKRPPPVGRAEILRRVREGQVLKYVFLPSSGRTIYTFAVDGVRAREDAVKALTCEQLVRRDTDQIVPTTPEEEERRIRERREQAMRWESRRNANKSERLRRWSKELIELSGDMPAFIEALERTIDKAGTISLGDELED